MCWYEGTLDIDQSLGAHNLNWDAESDEVENIEISDIFWKD